MVLNHNTYTGFLLTKTTSCHILSCTGRMNVAHIQQVSSSSQLRISRHNTNNNTLHIHHLCITHHQRKCDSCNQENLLHLQEVGYIWRESELSKSQPQTCQINRELRIPALGFMPPWRTPGGSSTQW